MSRHAQRVPRSRRRLPTAALALGVGAAVVVTGSSVALARLGDPPPAVVMSDPTIEPAGPPLEALTHPTVQPAPATITRITAKERARQLRRAAERAIVPTTFKVSSFNLLGAAHTSAHGNKPRFAAGSTRMAWAMGLIKGADVSVAGVQEFEPPQLAAFNRTSPGWGVFPGLSQGHDALANSVIWRQDTWTMVEGRTILIPYFYGKLRPMPYVKLRNLQTGQEIWFASFHNPASTRGPAEKWRQIALAKEAALSRSLSADGTPVVFTGDMNDKRDFFCPFTARSTMHASNGGSTGAGCQPPASMGIDWILGSPNVTFTDHARVSGGLVARTSDHPFVWAVASVGQ